MLYAYTEMESFTELDIAGYWSLLSEQRKKQVDRYKFFKNRKQSALAYILLRYALIHEIGIYEEVEFDYGPYGKPFIKGRPEICFNMSHSENGVVCALSEFPIGVDIADIDTKNLDCASTAMHKNEQIAIENSNDSARTFARYWALKESYLKYMGTGITNNLSAIDFSKFEENFFVFDSVIMQIQNTEKSVISCCCIKHQPIQFINKMDLFEILLGDTKHGRFAYA